MLFNFKSRLIKPAFDFISQTALILLSFCCTVYPEGSEGHTCPAFANTFVSSSLLLSVHCVIQFSYPGSKLSGGQ